eukprot:COSAG02_NODE_6738_length_3393_cov_2.353673_3_plen_185_part_00
MASTAAGLQAPTSCRARLTIPGSRGCSRASSVAVFCCPGWCSTVPLVMSGAAASSSSAQRLSLNATPRGRPAATTRSWFETELRVTKSTSCSRSTDAKRAKEGEPSAQASTSSAVISSSLAIAPPGAGGHGSTAAVRGRASSSIFTGPMLKGTWSCRGGVLRFSRFATLSTAGAQGPCTRVQYA